MHKRIELLVLLISSSLSAAVAAAIDDGLGRNVKQTPAASAPPATRTVTPAARVGKVVTLLNGSGYSYLELEAGGERFWVAATNVKAPVGSSVEYDQSVVMENFTSKFLNRTFDRIIFANSVKVVDKR